MGAEEVVERILSAKEGLTKEEVLRLVDGKKREAEGYLTEEGAALIVASELGVDVAREPLRTEVLIRDLVSGLNDVTVPGRVIIVYPPRTFTRSDGTEGKVARLLIADKSGTLKVTLWDDKASLVEEGKVEEGQIVRISHGYMREGFDGKLELHVGTRGFVQVSTPEAADQEYPSVTRFLQKIDEVTKGRERASLVGVVQRVSPVSTFKRQDGSVGKVMRVWLNDETGEIALVLWDRKVEELGDVKVGDCLRVMDVKVRANVDGRLEIHTQKGTQTERLKEGPELLGLVPPKFTKIGELRPGMYEVDVLGRVTHAGEVREFKRRSGGTGRVSTLMIRDETGHVPLNLWEDKSALSKQTQEGDIVLAEKAYTRERFGETSLNLGQRGTLTLNPEVAEAEALPPFKEEITAIEEVREEGGPLNVEGVLETSPTIREVTTTRGERIAVASFELADDTGKIRVSVWRVLVDVVKDLIPGNQIRMRNVYAKRGLADQLELTSRVLTSIEILPKT